MAIKLFRKFFLLSVLLLFIPRFSYAGIRGPGKYAGTVIFDRWGGCTLYSGIYVMYISEKVKQQLLPYKNQAIQIMATDVYQPMNPGDGLIKKFEYIGNAPAGQLDETDLQITTSAAFHKGEQPSILIQLTNTSKKDLRISARELAPTLLTRTDHSQKYIFTPSDGPSFALVTRVSFWLSSEEAPRWHGTGIENGKSYLWSIGKSHALPKYFSLKPNETWHIKISFHLPKGEYEFLCGYGGGVHEYTCVTSNLTPFDVNKEGEGKPVTSEGH